jgi:hypothetical protein
MATLALRDCSYLKQSVGFGWRPFCHSLSIMSGRIDELRIEVTGDEIMVFLPATSYGITYYKATDSPQLLAKDFGLKNDSRAPITYAEFLARAWQAANDKARDLGWIV